MAHNKFGPDRFSRFDVYWIQTNKHPDTQAKFVYRFIHHMNFFLCIKSRANKNLEHCFQNIDNLGFLLILISLISGRWRILLTNLHTRYLQIWHIQRKVRKRRHFEYLWFLSQLLSMYRITHTNETWAEHFRIVDIWINAWFPLFINLKTNLILR